MVKIVILSGTPAASERKFRLQSQRRLHLVSLSLRKGDADNSKTNRSLSLLTGSINCLLYVLQSVLLSPRNISIGTAFSDVAESTHVGSEFDPFQTVALFNGV